eukprot:g43883.t1
MGYKVKQNRMADKVHSSLMCSMPHTLGSNRSKTKELIIEFRKQGGGHAPVYINGVDVDRAESVKFLQIMITDNHRNFVFLTLFNHPMTFVCQNHLSAEKSFYFRIKLEVRVTDIDKLHGPLWGNHVVFDVYQ